MTGREQREALHAAGFGKVTMILEKKKVSYSTEPQ